MGLSPRNTVPDYGIKSREKQFNSVDFPQPLGPIRAVIFPVGSESETSLSTLSVP